MANLRISWDLPSTRRSGRPLRIDEIDYVDVQMSADQGANYVTLNEVPPSETSLLVNELEPGTYYFRLIVVDTKGRESEPVVATFTIEDDTPPGAVLNVVITLV
jgi:hypothetical protein